MHWHRVPHSERLPRWLNALLIMNENSSAFFNKIQTLHFNFALGLENYVSGPGQGELTQRLTFRNASWQERARKNGVTLGQGRGNHQVILELNRTRQRSVTQLEQVRSVAAIDTPEACLGVTWHTEHWL